jgi:LacI family transcriptional regulator
MSRTPPPATLQDIADQTGYGRSTVSMALRNHPSIPPETRQKIQDVAAELSYRPNPLIAALMTQLKGKRRKSSETIAIVTRSGQRLNTSSSVNFYTILYKAILERGAELGFKIDLFALGAEPLADDRLSQILMTRGIHGVIFFPGGSPDRDYPTLDWKHFAVVLIGFHSSWTKFHQIVSDYTHDIDLALQMFKISGGRRIGFAIPDELDSNTEYSWSSRFLHYQRWIPVKARVPFAPCQNRALERKSFLAWFEKHRPEALLVSGGDVPSWLKAEGYRVPKDVKLINLLQRGEKELAGIDPCTSEVGHAAVDLMLSLLQANQLGLPKFPHITAIKGKWVPGPSFPMPEETK